jgi:hypothetical protein
MRTVVSYIGNSFLNNSSSSVASGSVDATTGIAFPTGVNSGDFLELNDAQALAYSDTAVGTLYAGVYQRVKLKSGLTGLAIGQALFWDRTNTTDPYAVTNVSASGQVDFAGVYIDNSTTAGNYVWIQVTGKASCLLTGAGVIGAGVGLPASSTNEFVVATETFPTFAGVQLTAAAGAGDLALVTIRIPQTRY